MCTLMLFIDKVKQLNVEKEDINKHPDMLPMLFLTKTT